LSETQQSNAVAIRPRSLLVRRKLLGAQLLWAAGRAALGGDGLLQQRHSWGIVSKNLSHGCCEVNLPICACSVADRLAAQCPTGCTLGLSPPAPHPLPLLPVPDHLFAFPDPQGKGFLGLGVMGRLVGVAGLGKIGRKDDTRQICGLRLCQPAAACQPCVGERHSQSPCIRWYQGRTGRRSGLGWRKGPAGPKLELPALMPAPRHLSQSAKTHIRTHRC
jgi:hypothetical protein